MTDCNGRKIAFTDKLEKFLELFFPQKTVLMH